MQLEKDQLARARDIVAVARRSPFYAQKYKDAPATDSLTTMEAWRQLPLLTRDELYQNTYPRTRDMFTAPLTDAIVLSTGGSSGIVRNVVMANDEWEDFCQRQAEAFQQLDVRRDDVVANLFIAGHLWPSFLGVHEMVKKAHAVQLPISSNIPPEEVYQLCRKYEPTVMVSLPTLFVLLADLARRDNYRFRGLRLIAYAGEQLSREAEAHVRQWLGVEEIKALAYSSSDCGIMGYQCPHCGFGEYHLPTDFQMMEILNPDTLQPVAPGETGEVVITNLRRRFQPIIRYRIGDMAMWIPEHEDIGSMEGTSACYRRPGDRRPVNRRPLSHFRLAGRAGADFKLGGAYISVGVFEKAVARHADAFSLNFCLTLEDVGGQMDILLDIECAAPTAAVSIEAAAAIRSELIDEIHDLRGGLQINFIREFRVSPVPIGSIPRNPITGKVKKVVDKRTV